MNSATRTSASDPPPKIYTSSRVSCVPVSPSSPPQPSRGRAAIVPRRPKPAYVHFGAESLVSTSESHQICQSQYVVPEVGSQQASSAAVEHFSEMTQTRSGSSMTINRTAVSLSRNVYTKSDEETVHVRPFSASRHSQDNFGISGATAPTSHSRHRPSPPPRPAKRTPLSSGVPTSGSPVPAHVRTTSRSRPLDSSTSPLSGALRPTSSSRRSPARPSSAAVAAPSAPSSLTRSHPLPLDAQQRPSSSSSAKHAQNGTSRHPPQQHDLLLSRVDARGSRPSPQHAERSHNTPPQSIHHQRYLWPSEPEQNERHPHTTQSDRVHDSQADMDLSSVAGHVSHTLSHGQHAKGGRAQSSFHTGDRHAQHDAKAVGNGKPTAQAHSREHERAAAASGKPPTTPPPPPPGHAQDKRRGSQSREAIAQAIADARPASSRARSRDPGAKKPTATTTTTTHGRPSISHAHTRDQDAKAAAASILSSAFAEASGASSRNGSHSESLVHSADDSPLSRSHTLLSATSSSRTRPATARAWLQEQRTPTTAEEEDGDPFFSSAEDIDADDHAAPESDCDDVSADADEEDASCCELLAEDSSSDEEATPVTNNDRVIENGVIVNTSCFKGRSSTVAFLMGAQNARCPNLRIRMTFNTNAVRAAFRRAGFVFIKSNEYTIKWSKSQAVSAYKQLREYQKSNHFPSSGELGRKDRLHRCLNRLARATKSPGVISFYPKSFLLPHEYRDFQDHFNTEKSTWIWKPNASARGNGIRIITKLQHIPRSKQEGVKPALIQRYIGDPYLIDGFKFDLRIYVAVTCFDPLRAYIYPEGLTRFSTTPFKSLSKGKEANRSRFMHLTNFSVNKKSANFVYNDDEDADDTGSKWSLSALWRFLLQNGHSQREVDAIWEQIKSLVVTTLISVDDKVNTSMQLTAPTRNNCFELFGFDVLLDSKLTPWLIEVNTGPDMSSTSPLDKKIKHTCVTNLLNLVGLQPVDRKKFDMEQAQLKQDRLLGLKRGQAPPRTPPTAGMATASDPHTQWWHQLSPEAITWIQDCEDEHRRRGPFQRLLPNSSSGYLGLFNTSRNSNFVLHQWARVADNPPPELRQMLGMLPNAPLLHEFSPIT